VKTRIALLVVVLVTALAGAAQASAHEVSTVGDLAIEIGWGTEPAYVGQLNSVQVLIAHKADGDPIEDPAADLTATVLYGDQKAEFTLEPNFEEHPGEYRALLIPTAPGDYTFHVAGTVEGVDVDLKATSSPQTFSPVEAASTAQFPVKEPAAADIAARLDAELGRGPSQSEVDSARTLGMVGIVVGAVGIVLAALALVVRRRA
jgi:hypothetical protein